MTTPPDDVDAGEILELLIKAARRCAYDLDHASGEIARKETRVLFEQRAKMFQRIFNPANGPKDYRHRLHSAISELQGRVDGLLKLCHENNIECSKYENFPF